MVRSFAEVHYMAIPFGTTRTRPFPTCPSPAPANGLEHCNGVTTASPWKTSACPTPIPGQPSDTAGAIPSPTGVIVTRIVVKSKYKKAKLTVSL
jgi:hypothetical protein